MRLDYFRCGGFAMAFWATACTASVAGSDGDDAGDGPELPPNGAAGSSSTLPPV